MGSTSRTSDEWQENTRPVWHYRQWLQLANCSMIDRENGCKCDGRDLVRAPFGKYFYGSALVMTPPCLILEQNPPNPNRAGDNSNLTKLMLIWTFFFQHNFCVQSYVPREPRKDPSNRRLNEHGIYIRHRQESNSQPVPSQAGADTTRPKWPRNYQKWYCEAPCQTP